MTSPGILSPERKPAKPSHSSDPPGPPPESGDGNGGGEWVHLTTAGNSVIAHLIEGRLTGEGIPCFLDSFNPSPGAWLKPFGDPLAPVRVFVRRHFLGAASLVLHEIGHASPDPLNEGPPVVKTMLWVTIILVAALSLFSVLEIFLGNTIGR